MWPASPEEGQARGPVGGCKRHQVPAQSCQVGSWELVWRGPGLHCDVETDQGGSGKAWPGRCSGGVTCGQWAPRSPEAGGAGGRVIGRGRGSGAGRKDGETRSEDTDVKQPRGLAAGARPATVSTLAGSGHKPNGKLQARGCGGREAPLLRLPPGPGVPRRPPHGPPSTRAGEGGGAVSAQGVSRAWWGDLGTSSHPQQVLGPRSPNGWRPRCGAMHFFGNCKPTGSLACPESRRHPVSGRDASTRLAPHCPPRKVRTPERRRPWRQPLWPSLSSSSG